MFIKLTQYILPINVLELGVVGSLTMNYNTNICRCALLIENYISLVKPFETMNGKYYVLNAKRKLKILLRFFRRLYMFQNLNNSFCGAI